MGMVHTAHHTLAQQTFRLAGIIEKSLPYPHNCLQKLKFKLAKTNYTHYTSSYTETQQTRAFSDHFALWKCGKRLPAENCIIEMCITGHFTDGKHHSRPDGKAAGFPTARKHRFPQFRKHDRLRTFPQRLLRRISILSF